MTVYIYALPGDNPRHVRVNELGIVLSVPKGVLVETRMVRDGPPLAVATLPDGSVVRLTDPRVEA